MFKRLFSVLAILTILALAFPAPAFAAPTFSIHGMVTYAGKPLAGVKISTLSDGVPLPDVTTGANGKYVISGLDKGSKIEITPTLAMYRFAPVKMTFPNLGGNKIQNFTAFVKTRSISGKISPVPTEGPTKVFYTKTKFALADGTSGEYQIKDVPDNVTFRLIPQLLAFRFYDPVKLLPYIDVPPGDQDVIDQDFTAVELVQMSGKVTVEGKPVKGVTVTAHYTAPTPPLTDTKTKTMADGTYSMYVDKSELTPQAAHPYFTFADLVAVTPSAAFTQDWTDATVVVTGKVTEGLVGLAGVIINAGKASAVTEAVTGNYTLTVKSTDVPSLYGFLVIPKQVTGFTILPKVRPVVLGLGHTHKDFKAIRHNHSVSGMVTLNGKGLPGVEVSGGGKSAITNAAGKYILRGIPFDASVTLTAFKYGFTFSSIAPFLMPDANKLNQDFTATALSTPDSLSGKVTLGKTTTGVKNILITLTWMGKPVRTMLTDSSGKYSFTGLLDDTNHTVSATSLHYTLTPDTPQNVTFTLGVATQDFTAVHITSVKGRLFALPKTAPVTYTLDGGLATPITLGPGGSYVIAGLLDGSHTLAFASPGFTFLPRSATFTITPTTFVITKNFLAVHH